MMAGAVALKSAKRKGRHTSGGKTFMVSLAIATGFAAPYILLTGNVFLGGLGSVAAYLGYMGWRIGRVKPPNGSFALPDYLAVAAGLIGFTAFVAFGLWVVARGQLLGLAAAGIGGLGLMSAISHQRLLRGNDTQGWKHHHGSAIGGAFIATVTAFAAASVTNYLPMIPEWMIWLAPTVAFTPWLRRELAKANQPPTA
jgi:hypothetical protein